MGRRLRINIAERQHAFVLKNNLGGNLLADDLGENVVGHGRYSTTASLRSAALAGRTRATRSRTYSTISSASLRQPESQRRAPRNCITHARKPSTSITESRWSDAAPSAASS